MSEQSPPVIGSVAWRDLTVADAPRVRDFYREVVGWSVSEAPMSGYSDYGMHDAGGEMIAGVCHARGANANMPAQWPMYIVVADVEASAANCERLGGKVLAPIRGQSGGRFCVIQDPAGAVCALWQHQARSE